MKRLMLTALACCLCALTTLAQEPVAPDLRQLTAEVHKLRAELIQQQLEFQEWKLNQLARDLQQLRAEQQRWVDEERSLEQELAALDGAAAPTAPEAVSEAQALRTANDARTQRLRARQERLAELTAQWQQEETRRQQLAQQAQRLKTAAPTQ
jgi:hypothetical protein